MNQAFQLPEVFSNVIGLGTPGAWHPAKKWHRTGNLVVGLLLLGAGMVVVLYGVYATVTAWQKHGTAMIDDTFFLPGVGGMVLLLLGMAAGLGAYLNWNKGVVVYDKGFAYRDRKGVQNWTWEEIHSLNAAVTRHYTNGIYTGTTHQYTLLNRNGGKLVFSDALTKVEDLAAVIEQAIFPRLYAQAAEQYNSGQAISFGPAEIRKSGITIGKKTYPWPEVGQVSMERGFLRVSKKDGGWFSGASAPASAIPNLRVLLSIIDQVIGVKTG